MITPKRHPKQDAKVLIIDDNPNNLRMISDVLEDSEYSVFVAEDGESGLERACYASPDIILLDVLMPGIDGFETCRKLKSMSETRDIPVIFMTALSEAEHKVKAFNAGAVDYITKPFQKEEVLARLTVHLQIRELTANLNKANASLELRVAERTAQLAAANQDLAASRNYLNKIINAAPDPVFVKDRQHRWVLINDAFCNMLGCRREKLINKSDYDFFPENEADGFRATDEIVFTTGKETLNEEKLTDANGVVRTILTKKTLHTDEQGELFLVGIIRDITEYKAIEAQLRQAVKMEAIGTLAGGVAHDFNNLMTAVIGYSSLLLQRLDDDSPLCKDVEEIRKAGESAAALTHQLLAFSRKQVVQPKVLNLNLIISETEKMLGRLIGEDIEIIKILEPNLWRMLGDPGLIQQVIINLAINARDAMPKGGKLTIETRNSHLDTTYAAQHIEVTPGQYVLFAVSDNGSGMDLETQSHIFEPFFTTKAKGKGTGLGLATVYGIIKQSGGHIWVYSELNQGTTFKIYLPRVEKKSQSIESPLRTRRIKGGNESILVVEDDDTVRNLTKEILRPYGYQVIVASSGKNALQLLETFEGRIDLLITDVVMPEMGGRMVAKAVVSKYPDVKVLYISGYTDNAIVHHGVLDSGVAFLQKPFSVLTLSKRVRQVLDENILPGQNRF